MFYDVFSELCQKSGVSANKACIDIGVNRSAVAKWKQGGTPNGTTLAKMAKYFGVSVDYLLGNEEKPAAEAGDKDVLDEVDVAFYGEYRELTEEDKDVVRDMVRVMRERRKNKQQGR